MRLSGLISHRTILSVPESNRIVFNRRSPRGGGRRQGIFGFAEGAMAKRATPSLAASEYFSSNSDTSVQVWRARLQLIEAAKRVFPTFLEKLATDVFPLYCQLAKEGNSQRGEMTSIKRYGGSLPMMPSPTRAV